MTIRKVERRNLLQGLGLGAFATVALPGIGQAQSSRGSVLANASFRVVFDPGNGSIRELSHPSDPSAMNWVSSSENAPWQPRSLQWGLGSADIGAGFLHRGRWDEPQSVQIDIASATMTYVVGALKVEITRTLEGDALKERYSFTNIGQETFPLSDKSGVRFAIHTPLNDHYTSAADVMEHRCHAHLWMGGTVSWIAALRMGGREPHLGLVLTEGKLSGYSITGRDQVTASNTRGTILAHPALGDLKPGETKAIAWTLFWHKGWEDFFGQCARRSPAFVKFEADHYTAYRGEAVNLSVSGPTLVSSVLSVKNQTLPLVSGKAAFKADALGETIVRLTSASGTDTKVVLNVVPPIDELIAKRVKFIVTNQQVNNATDPADGAFVVYDNFLDAQVRNDKASDRNEARERIGMGVLLAQWLRGQPQKDPVLMRALERYHGFISTKMQRPDGWAVNGFGSDYKRLYNWAWTAHLHLEVARLTGSEEAYSAYVRTVESFYQNGGKDFYPIGLPVYDGITALKAINRNDDVRRLTGLFTGHAERIMEVGLNYPTSELNFEQAIVAPAAILLLEVHRVTGNKKWLTAAKPHLEVLELFGGRQPDHHLHEIAIRHWDGYWFGKNRAWGDTFPHYWSGLTAIAFHHYGKSIRDKSWSVRADDILRNNLSVFTPDGKGSAAFIYPISVNGQLAYFADAYANDQDWSLVHMLQIRES